MVNPRRGSRPARGTRRALAGGAALAGAAVATRARWAAASDPTGGRPLDLPPGQDFFVETGDGAVLSARACGPEGPVDIVLAHGWTADKRVWSATVRRLVAGGHRVVVYDQRGHGQSTVGSGPLTIATLALDMRTVLEQVDAHDVVVGGHSMGGMAAQRFAIDHKDSLAERVAALALISTAASDVVLGGPYARYAQWIACNPVADQAVGNPVTGPFLLRLVEGRRPVLGHLNATAETLLATPRRVRGSLLLDMSQLDLTEGLESVTVPTVVVSGTLDALTLPARSRRIADLIPGAELVAIPSAGHQLVFEAPDRLAEILGGLAPPHAIPGGSS